MDNLTTAVVSRMGSGNLCEALDAADAEEFLTSGELTIDHIHNLSTSPKVGATSSTASLSTSSTTFLTSMVDLDVKTATNDDASSHWAASPAASTSSKSSFKDTHGSIQVTPAVPIVSGRRAGHSPSPRSAISNRALAIDTGEVTSKPVKKKSATVPRVAMLAKPAPKKEIPQTPPPFKTGKSPSIRSDQHGSADRTLSNGSARRTTFQSVGRRESPAVSHQSSRKNSLNARDDYGTGRPSSARSSNSDGHSAGTSNTRRGTGDSNQRYYSERYATRSPTRIAQTAQASNVDIERDRDPWDAPLRFSSQGQHLKLSSTTRIPSPRPNAPPSPPKPGKTLIPRPSSAEDETAERNDSLQERTPSVAVADLSPRARERELAQLEVNESDLADIKKQLDEVKLELGMMNENSSAPVPEKYVEAVPTMDGTVDNELGDAPTHGSQTAAAEEKPAVMEYSVADVPHTKPSKLCCTVM